MEDFDLFFEKEDLKEKTSDKEAVEKALEILREEASSSGQVEMSVSPICRGMDGKQFACVMFTDGVRKAEGKIPACVIEKNEGFAKVELEQLEQCMRDNLDKLKEMAAGIHVLDAFMK